MSSSNAVEVVVVEDEPRMRELLLRMLHELGYEATAFGTGEQAWRELSAGDKPTILVVDLNLPGMTGLALYEKVRQLRDSVAAIVLTGFASVEAAQQAIRLEAVDFLTKPCHLGDLEGAVVRAEAKLRQATTLPATMMQTDESDEDATSLRTMDEVEHAHIVAALARHGGNRKATADELGISLRTLYYRLKRYRGDE